MSDIKLFRIDDGSMAQLTGTSVALEKSLQHLIEKSLNELLGVTFLAGEIRQEKHRGSLGRVNRYATLY
jgi:hypothetical protein